MLKRRCESILLAGCLVLAAGCGDELARSQTTSPGGEPTFPTCRRTDPVIELGELPADVYEIVPQPRISGGQVVWQRRHTTQSNAATDLEIFLYDPERDVTEQLTANDWDDFIIDAGQGSTLFMTSDPATGTYQVVWERDGSEVVVQDGLERRLFPYFEVDARGVSAQAAVWVMPDDPDRGYENGVYLYDDGEMRRISGTLLRNGMPDLQGRDVVWAASNGSETDIAYSSAEDRAAGRNYRWLDDNDVPDQDPLLAGNRVFWLGGLAGETPTAFDLESGQLNRLEAYRCRDHSADEGTAVYVCFETDGPEWPSLPQQLVLFDGRQGTAVLRGRGDIRDVAIDGHAVAWVEYPTDADYTGGAQGTVYYLDDVGDAGAEPVAVAPIGSGCWWCDAYWPDAVVRLEGGLMAWNYGNPQAENPPYTDFAIGYALLRSSVSCSEAGDTEGE